MDNAKLKIVDKVQTDTYAHGHKMYLTSQIAKITIKDELTDENYNGLKVMDLTEMV